VKSARVGPVELEATPTGLAVRRDLNAMQVEHVGLIPWGVLFELIADDFEHWRATRSRSEP
jgi:hypothetical protein